MESVEEITPNNSDLFYDYIIPWLSGILRSSNELIRCKLYSQLSRLFSVAVKFIELSQAFNEQTESKSFDASLEEILKEFESFIYQGLTDASIHARQAILSNLVEICMHLGTQRTNDLVLSHSVTYLNHKDPQLRASFFCHITSLSTIIGPKSLEQYVLPLLLQSLNDPDEMVIERDLNCLTSLSELGLIRKQKILSILQQTLPLIFHPNIWIRKS